MYTNKEADDRMIRPHVTSLIKKYAPNPSNGACDVLSSSENYDTTQETTSTLVLESVQKPENMDELGRGTFP